MKAAVLEGIKNVVVKEIPTPEPGFNEALVKIKACGICQTDYSAFTGARTNWKPPLIVGHEISGVIEKIHKDKSGYFDSNFNEGDEVIVNPMVSCGKCNNCLRGYLHYCENGLVLGGDGQKIVKNGGFAEYLCAPISTLFLKPKNISFRAACLTEPLAGSYKGLIEYTNLKIAEDIVVIGAGSMGMLVMMIALKAGAGNLIAVDISDFRLDFAKKLGVPLTINSVTQDVRKKIYEILPNGPDIVFEAAGALEAAKMTFDLVRRGTRVNIFGVIIPGTVPVSPADIHFLETRVDASFSVTPKYILKSIDLMSKKIINPEKIITHIFTLDEMNTAFETMKNEDRVKVIIEP